MEDEQKELQAKPFFFILSPQMINTAKEKDQSPLFSAVPCRAELVGTKGTDFEQSFVRGGERRFHYRVANPACSLREIPGWSGGGLLPIDLTLTKAERRNSQGGSVNPCLFSGSAVDLVLNLVLLWSLFVTLS